MIFAAMIPQILQAIMGSGAVAIPAMTAATGAAGAAGGTVGAATAAAPASSATGSPIGSVTGNATDFGEAAGSIGTTGKMPTGGAGGMQVGGSKPLEVGPGQRYGGTGGTGRESGWQGNTGDVAEGDPMPPKPAEEWLPYKVPKSGFGRFAQRLGGNDPALGNSRYLANKYQFGEQKAMQMEMQQNQFNQQNQMQNSQQSHQSGESAKARQAQEEQERERRGWQAQRDANQFTFQNAIHQNEMQQRARELAQRQSAQNTERMDTLAGSTGTYDPILQNDRLNQLYNQRVNAPHPIGSNAFWSPENPDSINILDRGADPSFDMGDPSRGIAPRMVPARPPGVISQTIGGSGAMPAAPAGPVQVDPSRLQFMPPAAAPAPAANLSPVYSWADRLMDQYIPGRPVRYPTAAPR